MERIEATRRIFDAVQILLAHRWTKKEIDTALTGLSREDAVETAERHAEHALAERDLEDNDAE